MPELPHVLRERLASEHGLSEYDAATVTQSKAMARYFLDAVAAGGQPKLVCNWITGELSRRLNAQERDVDASSVSAATLAVLVQRIADGTVSNNAARQVFDALWSGEVDNVDALIEAKGLRQMNDSGALESIIDDVIAANGKSVEEFRQGKDKAFNALVGQIMKASRGKANPAQVNEVLRKKLA
jgi:aspartyl-tRNA(Asn)/glutamyl-tRNA(Gln) amidotransferase subunit B